MALQRVLLVTTMTAAVLAGGCRHEDAPEKIPQPAVQGLPVAPESARVDLAVPAFSDPTTIDNPLFPVSRQESVLLLGRVDGQPFRTEVTLLPETRIVEWQGRQVGTLVSQYVAYLDGRIHEVAYDLYAQDDDGAVWYFGEDVFNFEDGAIVDTHGTWIAGRDGPAAMIMPAGPEVGDVYRPENIPGFVFEEVTVKSVGRTLDGPLGPVEGGLVVEELHLDASTEGKTFAPGYGEFFTSGGGDVEALALAVPTDALPGPVPAGLVTLERGAGDAFEAAGSGEWGAARATVSRMRAAWATVRTGPIPDRLEPQLSAALETLTAAVGRNDAAAARAEAIVVARWSLDLQLRYRPVLEVDLARFGLWAAQLAVDAAAGDEAAVRGDAFSLDYVRDRLRHGLADADRTRLDAALEELGGAIADGELAEASEAAAQLRETVARLRRVG